MANLYMMSNSIAPGILKIGRSDNPQRRASDLQSCQCFWITVVAELKDFGGYEAAVHQRLSHLRIDGAGKEWFRVDVAGVLAAIIEASRPHEAM